MCSSLVITIVTLVVASVTLYLLWTRVVPKTLAQESYNADYSTLGGLYDRPLFEPNVLQRCAEGSYMFTDNPMLTDFCSKVPASVLDRTACKRAFHGRPFHLSYTVPAYACKNSVSCNRVEPVLELA